MFSRTQAIARLTTAVGDQRERTAESLLRIARAVLLDTPLSIDRGEVTDKGSINQRAVLTHRAAAVERLYADAAARCLQCPPGECEEKGGRCPRCPPRVREIRASSGTC